jgi:hypothetical protein
MLKMRYYEEEKTMRIINKIGSLAVLLTLVLGACSSAPKETTRTAEVSSGADVSQSCDPNSKPYQQLRRLALLGKASMVRELLSTGIDVNCRFSDAKWKNYTALMAAATAGWKETTRTILAYHPDLNIVSELDGGCKPATAYLLAKDVARTEATAQLILEYADARTLDIVLSSKSCPADLHEGFRNLQVPAF